MPFVVSMWWGCRSGTEMKFRQRRRPRLCKLWKLLILASAKYKAIRQFSEKGHAWLILQPNELWSKWAVEQEFNSLKIGESLLASAPDQWNTNEDYQRVRDRLKQLRVVNDTAERGVKLFQEFNKLITNDEEEKQFFCRSWNRIAKRFQLTQQRSQLCRSHISLDSKNLPDNFCEKMLQSQQNIQYYSLRLSLWSLVYSTLCHIRLKYMNLFCMTVFRQCKNINAIRLSWGNERVVEHRLPIGVGSWNFATIML